MNENNALSLREEMEAPKAMFTSLNPTDRASQVLLYKGMNQPDKKISDCINMTLYIKDVFCEMVDIVNQETGEVSNAPRTVLFDKDGITYQAVSTGIFSSIKKLITIFGMPTWEEPMPLTVRQVKRGKNNILTLDVEQ